MKFSLSTMLALAGLGLGLTTVSPGAVRAGESAPSGDLKSCGQEGTLALLCGPNGVEDMQWLTGTDWVIGSGAKSAADPGGLRLLDIEHKTWSRFYPNPAAKAAPDTATYAQCPGAPDPAKFEAHGISLKQTGPKAFQLAVVNHGREAVEAFTVSTKTDTPEITWVGCVPMGDRIYMNSVTFLPEGGFAATKFYDRTHPRGMLSIFAGGTTGGVYEWHTKTGITEVPGTDLAGANGIVASPDGKWLYVAGWGSKQLIRVARSGDANRDVVDLDFSPDNLHWAPDGSILVAGQRSTPDPESPMPAFKGWEVVKLNPASLAVTKIATGAGDSALQGVSNAIDIKGTLWLGAYTGKQIGHMPMP
jgi:SMP-30/Gluconolactonase/LRE-like region